MLIVYRTDFAGRDEHVVDTYQIPGARYICFTDRTELPAPWEVHPPKVIFECPRLTNIYHKLHPHKVLPPHSQSVYLNASEGLTKDPTPCLKSGFIAAHRHRLRNCLFEEAKFCRDAGIVAAEETKKQVDSYAGKVKERPTGLWETGALVRCVNHGSDLIGELWWEHIKLYSERDQISLAYINTQFEQIVDIPGDFSNSEYFHFTPHGGPLPADPEEARRRFPNYMRRRDEWAANAKQSLQAQEDAALLV